MRILKKGFFLTVMAVALCVTGCGTGEEEEVKATPTMEAVMTEKPATEKPEPTPEVTVEPESERIELKIYRGNEEANDLLCDTVYVEDIDMDNITEQLILAKVLSESVVLNKGSQTEVDGKNTLLLDFNQEFAKQVQGLGSSGESILMGSVVNTFLQAMGADQVMITVDGEMLETGHVVYDSYLEKYDFTE